MNNEALQRVRDARDMAGGKIGVGDKMIHFKKKTEGNIILSDMKKCPTCGQLWPSTLW